MYIHHFERNDSSVCLALYHRLSFTLGSHDAEAVIDDHRSKYIAPRSVEDYHMNRSLNEDKASYSATIDNPSNNTNTTLILFSSTRVPQTDMPQLCEETI